ncbi:transglutaminase domain-containing protein [Clostridium magnum]|uniref:Transglutaminase-like superfamily protein n=1 Tax=Clostridium magnum DSM 2767 TaxID=1121326 RepID=A0A161YHJ3_9CLOT|nr:transglutaminase domain-containing protein [Clostridium magnum]KZL89742.1 transglutaminase-like superfamily protein [Clostridium magnum DSM 2767]SHH65476.1 Ig-like domain-containing protein [Clostridium magnum DSM 2767]
MKKLIKFFVIILGVIFFNMTLVGAEITKGTPTSNKICGNISWASPFYNEGDRLYSGNDTSDTLYVDASSEEELKKCIMASIQSMRGVFFIHYTGDSENLKNLLKDTLDGRYDYSGYGRCLMKCWKCSYDGYSNNVMINFNIEYVESKEQADAVDKKIREILAGLITVDMNEFQKEKAIHDYIVKNVAYDETKDKYSDYDGLFNGKTVCQGYALLNYKMLTMAGIKTRIVIGIAGGAPHGWNMVNIKDNWYHVDCTWDDPIPDIQGRVNNGYFNVTDDAIEKDHSWDKTKYEACTSLFKYESLKEVLFEPTGQYKVVKNIKDASVDRKFTIKFSKELNKDILNKDSIVFVKGYDGEKLSFKIENLGTSLVITPEEKLKPFTKYYIIINEGITAVDGSETNGNVLIKIETAL